MLRVLFFKTEDLAKVKVEQHRKGTLYVLYESGVDTTVYCTSNQYNKYAFITK